MTYSCLFLYVDTSWSQCKSSDCASMPVTNDKCVDMPIAKHREEVILFYFFTLLEAENLVLCCWGVFVGFLFISEGNFHTKPLYKDC